MTWHSLSKLWPAPTDVTSIHTTRFNPISITTISKILDHCKVATSSFSINEKKDDNDNNSPFLNSISKRTFCLTLTSSFGRQYTMERQRSAKRSSFRMRISRRIRAGFMPVPNQDSDSDTVWDGTPATDPEFDERRNEVQVFKEGDASKEKDEKKVAFLDAKERLKLAVSEIRHLGGSVRGTRKEQEKYDLTVDTKVQLGFSFRKKRRSFGSESEKRRGERFIRREIEKRKTVEESDSSDSSESHVCDFNCPLIRYGECPNSNASKRKLKAQQRRSSFTSSSTRESALTSTATSSHRPRPLTSVSTDDLSGAGAHDYGDTGPSVKSPGMRSTASMWSTGDLHHAPGMPAKAEGDNVSHVGSNSLSNVSGSFSERMHELVRAFSNRTQRTKEKLSQPPTPSSDSDYDAKSAVSAENENQVPRNIRLGSFLPMGSRASDAFSDENHDHFVGVWHCRFKTPKFLKRLKFPSTMEPHSKMYVSWLLLVALAFMYNAIVIPLRGVFPYQTSQNVKYWLIADYVCDFIYLLDILLFKSRLRFADHGIIECDRNETKKYYMKKLMFKFDLLSLIPLDLLYFIENVGVNPWLRLPRVLKIQTYWEFYERCDQASRSSAHAIRIVKTMTYMLFLIHIEACGYYAVSVYEGLNSNLWVYDGKGIAYIRCFYLATKTATSIGNNPDPTNVLEYSFMTLYWLSGVFVFALLIGQIRDIVEAAGMVKDNYRKKMDSCLYYMQSINLPKEMKDKVREWFLYNWDQQKTIDERSLVSSLPKKLQTDLAINVHFNTLSKVQLFQDCERNLLYDLVLKLRPILYLPGDYICKKGEVGKEMYIVSQGQVEVVGGENNETVLATLHEGSVFGEISLLAMSGRGNRRTADVRSKGYTNVFTLSKHDFEMAMTEYPDAQAVLKKRAKKLLRANARMEKMHKKVQVEEIIKTSPETPKLLQTVIQVMDPDSNLVKHLAPNVKTGRGNLRRPHSRSHSHRLSPSASNVHHLTPPRSHSFRLSTQTSTHSLNPSSHEQTYDDEKDGFNTDDENEEPMFDDTSDDFSLSEMLHDAGAISSFEDDDEGDEMMIIQRLDRKHEPNRQVEIWMDPLPQTLKWEGNEGEKERKAYERRDSASKEDETSALSNLNGSPSNKRFRKSREELYVEILDSGQPAVVRPKVQSSTYNNNFRQVTNGRSKSNSKNSKNGEYIEERSKSNTEQSKDECESNVDYRPLSRQASVQHNQTASHNIDSVENYLDKQRWTSDAENRMAESSKGNFKGENLITPKLTLSPQSSSDGEAGPTESHQRKLSIINSPTSPSSPRDNQTPEWVSASIPQVTAVRENGSDLLMRCFTPLDVAPISPLPVDSERAKSPKAITVSHSLPVSTNSPALTNGLEGCCGGGPIVDIPAENRVTCAVEIHRHKGVSSSTTDIHGHTETML